MKRKICAVWLLMSLFVGGVWGIFPSPRITLLVKNHSNSMPTGYYLRVPMGTIEAGDYVCIDLPADLRKFMVERGWMAADDLLIKEVGAVAGEPFRLTSSKDFYVKDGYVGKIAEKDSNGRPLPQYPQGDYIVPRASFLPISRHPRSFDGRYFGPLSLSRIQYKVIPLTWFNF